MAKIETIWEKRKPFSQQFLELWLAADSTDSNANLYDLSGKGRDFASSGGWALQSNILNGNQSLYNDNSKNPFTWAGTEFTAKHVFLVCKMDEATFSAARGLLTGATTNPLLVGTNAADKFADNSLGANFVYKKSYVDFANNNLKAPISTGGFKILEFVMKDGLSLSDLQIGKDRNNGSTNFKGWFSELIIFNWVRGWHGRQEVYKYFAEKYCLWRETSDGKNLFPFPNNHQSPFKTVPYVIRSQSLPNGKFKERRKGSVLQQFDFGFEVRRQSEILAARTFEKEHLGVKEFAAENNSFYPPRQVNLRMLDGVQKNPNSINFFGYQFSAIQTDETESAIVIVFEEIPIPPETDPPTTIEDLTYSSKNTHQIVFTFTAPTDASGIGGYQYTLDNGGTWTNFTPTGTTTKTGTISNLLPNTSYTIKVRSFDGASSPNYSAASNAITQTTINFTTISSLAYVSKNQSSITLSFTNPSETLAGYQYRIDGGSWTNFTPTGTGTKTFTVSGLSHSTEYDIEVRTFDGKSPTPNYSAASNMVTQTTDTPPPFWDVVASGWTAQGDNDLEATSVNYSNTTRAGYDLLVEGDYFEYIEGASYGIIVDNPNGNLLALGLNDTIYSHAGGYGNNPGTTQASYNTSPGNTMRWEIVNVSGNLKLRLKNITNATTEYTSSYTLDLDGGDRVEIRFHAYGDSIGTIFPKPTIRSGGTNY